MLFVCLLCYLMILFAGVKINNKFDYTNFLNKEFTNNIRGLAILAIVISHLINMVYFSWKSDTSAVKFIFAVLAPIGVGLFFFLSGYGNVFSLKKSNNFKWISKKVLRLFITLLPALIIQYVCSLIIQLNIFKNFENMVNYWLTLTIPPFTMWYLKVQAFAYIVLFLSYKFWNKKYEIVLFMLTSIYIIYCILTDVGGMWWVSIMCFPIGVIFAKHKDEILLNKFFNPIKLAVFLLIITSILFILVIPLKTTATFYLCISSCLLIAVLSIILSLMSNLLSFLGAYSLEIYISHLAIISIIDGITLNIPYEKSIKMLIVFISTIVVAPSLKKFCAIIEKGLRGK